MQTFLPFPDFRESARCLDYRRLGKQRVETKQILEINLIRIKPENYVFCRKCWTFWEKSQCNPGINGIVFCPNCKLPDYMTYAVNDYPLNWENHPAVLMWRGCEFALSEYGYIICERWKDLGYRDNLGGWFWNKFCNFGASGIKYELPDWYKDSAELNRLCYSHRSNLLRKYPEYYSEYFSGTDSVTPYYWPVKKEIK